MLGQTKDTMTKVAQKTNNENKAANTSVDTPSTPPVEIPGGKSKAELLRDQAKGEADAFFTAVQSMATAAQDIGPIALSFLAERLGASANKLGRPGEVSYLAFVAAMTGRNLSYAQRAELARVANGAVPLGHKPVAVVRAKASNSQGAASYRFNTPASVEITLG